MLAELLSRRIANQPQVSVVGNRKAKPLLQGNVACRRGEQVRAADHVRDTGRGIVHDCRQVVGPPSIGALDHEVAELTLPVELLRTCKPVVPTHCPAADAKPPRPGFHGAVPAGTRVHGPCAQVASSAGTTVGCTELLKPCKGNCIGGIAGTLVYRRGIRYQSEGVQGAQNPLRSPRHLPRRI